MFGKTIRNSLFILLFVFFITLPASTEPTVQNSAPALASSSEANNLLGEMAKQEITSDIFWNNVQSLESMGNSVKDTVMSGLRHPEVKVRIGCAKVLYQWELRAPAVQALISILEMNLTAVDKPTYYAATELLGNLISKDNGGNEISKEDLVKKVKSILEATIDTYRRLGLAKLWYDLDKSSQAIKEIRDMANLKDSQVRLNAALVLASMRQFESSKNILKELALDPTPTGRLAKAFLDYKDLQDAFLRRAKSSKSEMDYSTLDEIVKLIKDYYVDPSLIDSNKFINSAAKGISSTLDRFTSYEDELDKKRAQESISGKYGGIGAYVNMRDDFLTIERPMYGQPAYKAGLRSLDRVTEVEGESTMGKDLQDLINKLKGDPGTPVKIKVYRRGWLKEREFTLTRAIVNVKTARYEILPGNIGYLLITSFSTETDSETKECLDEMAKQGVKAVIVDVRNNPGGLLNVVSNIVDLFVEKDKIVVTTRDKGGEVQRISTRDDYKIDVPLYILINAGSASASEILSGALQDYHKATLIGETTFGKGSVQRIFELDSTDKKTAIRLTIAKYYLPSGRSIHKGPDGKGGVEPDIKVTVPELDLGKASEFNKLLDSGELDKYTTEHYSQNRKLMESLADDDGEDSSRYPAFDEFYKTCKARLEKEEVRQALRDFIRRKVADERQKEFLVDLQQDAILQRAIVEVCRLPGLEMDAEKMSPYKSFAHKFDNNGGNSTTKQK